MNTTRWDEMKDRIDLVEVAYALLGEPQKKSGGSYYWRCPFHDETKPSFQVTRGKPRWKCWGCDVWGNAIDLVMRIEQVSFKEALQFLSREEFYLDDEDVCDRPSTRSPSEYVPSGLSEEKALELVATSQRSLHLPECSKQLAYLTDFRFLSLETIHTHRLGWAENVLVPKSGGSGFYCTTGWVIPCFEDNKIAMVAIRKLDDRDHKYDTIYLNRQRFICYPNSDAIQLSRPLIVTEGPFDALLLGQILGEQASVVTLGGTSEHPSDLFFSFALRSLTHRYIALHSDSSGDNAAARWPTSFQRVRPPGYKDWTDAHRGGFDLLQGWLDILAGREPEVWKFESLRPLTDFVFDELTSEAVSEEEIQANNDWIDRFVRGETESPPETGVRGDDGPPFEVPIPEPSEVPVPALSPAAGEPAGNGVLHRAGPDDLPDDRPAGPALGRFLTEEELIRLLDQVPRGWADDPIPDDVADVLPSGRPLIDVLADDVADNVTDIVAAVVPDIVAAVVPDDVAAVVPAIVTDDELAMFQADDGPIPDVPPSVTTAANVMADDVADEGPILDASPPDMKVVTVTTDDISDNVVADDPTLDMTSTAVVADEGPPRKPRKSRRERGRSDRPRGRLTLPLKWHGGKHYLAPTIVDLMPPHIHYCEPFFGGGAVLLARDPADERLWLPPVPGVSTEGVSELINDLDGRLMNFWRVLQRPDTFEAFRRRLEATPFSRDEWMEAVATLDEGDEIDRAASFYIWCRQSLAGRRRDFASISRARTRRRMNEQVSAWLGAIEGLPAVHDRLKRVVVENLDAIPLIRREDTPDTLTYCDPPYVPGSRASPDVYEHEMSLEQHEEFLDAVLGCKGKVIISGYPTPLYDGKLAGWDRREYNLPNNAAGGGEKRRMVEVLWANFKMAPR